MLTVESDETVPLPISRRNALDGGDVTLQFAAVEQVVAAASMTAGFPVHVPGSRTWTVPGLAWKAG